MMAIRLRTLSLAGTLALSSVAVAACGDSTGPGINRSAALFTGGAFVDYREGNLESEAWNTEVALNSYGLDVKTFNGSHAADITAAVKGRRYLVIPEQERNCINGWVPAATLDAIRTFVNNGGVLVVLYDDCGLVNNLFSHSISTLFDGGPYDPTVAVTGTPFDGILNLSNADAVVDYDPATLPAAAVSLFETPFASAAFYIPEGTGAVVVLGADFYDMAPFGFQDGGWVAALDAATSFRP